MRIRLNLEQTKPEQFIPVDYQYALSSFIYNTIESSDSSYSRWLHDNGFRIGNKTFKFFTFSKLFLPKREIIERKFRITFRHLSFILSLFSTKSAENFIRGLFEKQKLTIKGKDYQADFLIKTVETIPDPEFISVMSFKTLSPIIVSKYPEDKSKNTAYYMSPNDEDYFQYFNSNLQQKYLAYCTASGKQVKELSLKSFKVLHKPASRLIAIKPGQFGETKVRGYDLIFELEGSPELIHLGYEVGFGNLTAGGFGCVEVYNKNEM